MKIMNYTNCTIDTPCSVKKNQDFLLQIFLNNNSNTPIASLVNDTGSDAALVSTAVLNGTQWEQTITASQSNGELFNMTIAAGGESETLYFESSNN